MKRYKVVARTREVGPGYAEMRENPAGEWVNYHETAVLLEALCYIAIGYIDSIGLQETCMQELNKILEGD
jgi:hypothetical protein